MSSGGSATLSTLQQVNVSVAYDDHFEYELSVADSTALANAFTLAGNGASFTASLDGAAAKPVIVKALTDGLCKSQAVVPASWANKKIGVAIYDEMVAKWTEAIENNIANILETSSFSTSVGYDGGANSMVSKLVPLECEILAQQIPEANYVFYQKGGAGADKEDPRTHALPMRGNDSIVLVFNVVQTDVIRTPAKVPGLNLDTGASSVAGGDASPYGAMTPSQYSSWNRTFAYKLTFKNTAGDNGALDSLKP
jgi:hypothetical protein